VGEEGACRSVEGGDGCHIRFGQYEFKINQNLYYFFAIKFIYPLIV
jgi:hypothetical protein